MIFFRERGGWGVSASSAVGPRRRSLLDSPELARAIVYLTDKVNAEATDEKWCEIYDAILHFHTVVMEELPLRRCNGFSSSCSDSDDDFEDNITQQECKHTISTPRYTLLFG